MSASRSAGAAVRGLRGQRSRLQDLVTGRATGLRGQLHCRPVGSCRKRTEGTETSEARDDGGYTEEWVSRIPATSATSPTGGQAVHHGHQRSDDSDASVGQYGPGAPGEQCSGWRASDRGSERRAIIRSRGRSPTTGVTGDVVRQPQVQCASRARHARHADTQIRQKCTGSSPSSPFRPAETYALLQM